MHEGKPINYHRKQLVSSLRILFFFSHGHFWKRQAVLDSCNFRAKRELRCGKSPHCQTFLRNTISLKTQPKKTRRKSEAAWVCLPGFMKCLFLTVPLLPCPGPSLPVVPFLFTHLQKKMQGCLSSSEKTSLGCCSSHIPLSGHYF